MGKELPQSTIVAIVVVFVILVAGIGWFYLSHNSDEVVAVAGQHGAMSPGNSPRLHSAGRPNE